MNEKERYRQALRDITNLCENCCNLSDAVAIANKVLAEEEDKAKFKSNKAYLIHEGAQNAISEFEFRTKIKKLKNALQDLLDEQNGPPLIRRGKQWQEAVDNAVKLIKEPEISEIKNEGDKL